MVAASASRAVPHDPHDPRRRYRAQPSKPPRQRIAPHVRRTPLLRVDGADFGLPGVPLVFKLEYLQHAGSFKARGAFNHLLTRAVPRVGVVAASGGNHGAAVAYAAGPPAGAGDDLRAQGREPDQDRADPRLWGHAEDRRRALCRCAGGQRGVHAGQRRPADPRLRPDRDAARPGHGGPRARARCPAVGSAAGVGGRRRLDRRHRGVDARPPARDRRRARARTDADARARRPASRWMRRLAASPQTRWRHGASARWHSKSPSITSSAPCWSATTRSATRSARCGACCAWSSSLAVRRRWRRCSAAPCGPSPGETVGVLLCGANTTAVSFD